MIIVRPSRPSSGPVVDHPNGIDDVVKRMIYETSESVDVIPSSPGLEGANNNLANVPIEQCYTKRPTDSYVYTLCALETDDTLSQTFRHRDLVPAQKQQ